jgi:two-component system, NarL family, sensor histidine kinase UhpB
LVNALIALCTRVARQGDMRVQRDLRGPLPPLSEEVELVIYRVAQEALTNALRYARGSEVTVELRCMEDRVQLRVCDDGSGLPEFREERGLAGMRERAMLIGAELELGSRAGRGTEILLSVPLLPGQR